jgi:PKD domain
VVRRDHIGALNPADGKALEWNPGSDSFEGNKAMEATARGLFVGGDGMYQGGRNTGRVAFYDFNSVPAPSPIDTGVVNPIEGRVVASLATANATSTAWTLPVTITGNRELQVMAKTFAVTGGGDATKAVKKFESFSVDDQTPTTSINGPSGSVLASTTFIATGTANDDKGVNALTYWFRNASNQYLQEDGSVSSSFNTFRGTPDVVGATSATWQYEVTLPHEGEWRMSATAIDNNGHGNVAPTPVINQPACTALVCNLSGVGSADPNTGDTFTYLWNFGDGTPTGTSSAMSHTFPAAGTWTVTLTVTDGWGRAASTTRQVTVTAT